MFMQSKERSVLGRGQLLKNTDLPSCTLDELIIMQHSIAGKLITLGYRMLQNCYQSTYATSATGGGHKNGSVTNTGTVFLMNNLSLGEVPTSVNDSPSISIENSSHNTLNRP